MMVFLQVAEGIKPTLAELERFEEQPEAMDMECILILRLPCTSVNPEWHNTVVPLNYL